MVQHDKKFYLTVNGEKYKAVYVNYGRSYATISIWIEVKYTVRKFLLFGEKLEKTRWSKIANGYSNQYQRNQSIKRRSFYDEDSTIVSIKEIIDLRNEECTSTHSPFLN